MLCAEGGRDRDCSWSLTQGGSQVHLLQGEGSMEHSRRSEFVPSAPAPSAAWLGLRSTRKRSGFPLTSGPVWFASSPSQGEGSMEHSWRGELCSVGPGPSCVLEASAYLGAVGFLACFAGRNLVEARGSTKSAVGLS